MSDTLQGIHAFFEDRLSVRAFSFKNNKQVELIIFSTPRCQPQCSPASTDHPPPPPPPEPCLLTMRRELFCFFEQVWTPISFSATWYSLVATVVSHPALLLIWSEVIKEIILTQLRFPEFPEVANSAPQLYFLFQINFVLTLDWEWIFVLINFCGKKVGLCVLMPTRAPKFL